MSQMSLLTLIAKIKFSRKLPNLQYIFGSFQVDIAKVEMLCKLLESLLFSRGGPDFNMDPNKLNILICTTFVFCYLWSIGGNIIDANWDAFDTFVRQQFDDNGDAKVFTLTGFPWALEIEENLEN